ncbi:MAG TPA: DCC1-like thiol-disulfide oxidoreductase family protein [Vicinamibacterales bacterium]|jgi:predicted DCC family thiol-disulfide oxidoreductase YuxK
MTNGWTGGQYSLCRVLLGAYLFVHFAALLPWTEEIFSNRGVLPAAAGSLLYLFPNVLSLSDSPTVVGAILTFGALAAVFFMAGLYDRTAAIVMWYVLACLFARNPLIANPSLPFIGWLLLWHVCLPSSPYGSWSARQRIDPRGGWRMPPVLFAAEWVVMSVGYSYSGYTKLVGASWVDGSALARVLDDPLAAIGTLELAYAPLALVRRARPWIWVAMFGVFVGMVLMDFAHRSLGMVILHLFMFDPQWVSPRWIERQDMLFYDGTCGLCHRAARFVLSEDRQGTAFRFAPLQGDAFTEAVTHEDRTGLPDSVIIRTQRGELLTRSDAVIYTMERLGGLWRVIAYPMRLVPKSLRNGAYDFIARIRYRLFPRANTICPILPADLRARFHS